MITKLISDGLIGAASILIKASVGSNLDGTSTFSNLNMIRVSCKN